MTKRTIISTIAMIVIGIILAKLMMLISINFIQCAPIWKIIFSIGYVFAFIMLLGDAYHVIHNAYVEYHKASLKLYASVIVEIFTLAIMLFGTKVEYVLIAGLTLVINTFICLFLVKNLNKSE